MVPMFDLRRRGDLVGTGSFACLSLQSVDVMIGMKLQRATRV
jgi:hypothetical protein